MQCIQLNILINPIGHTFLQSDDVTIGQQKSASRQISGISDMDPMEMALLLRPSLPRLARLAQRGLLSDTDLPRLVFDQEDLTKLDLTAEER